MAEVSTLEKLLHDAANHATRSQRMEFNGVLDEMNVLGKSCCHFCCCCCCKIPSGGRAGNLSVRRRGEDYHVGEHGLDGDTENDINPQYQFILKHLKPYKTSYMLEYKKQGVDKIVKYEVDECLLENPDEKSQRVFRNYIKRKDELPVESPIAKKQKRSLQSTPAAEKDKLTRRSSFSKETRCASMKKLKIATMDPEYSFFFDNCSVSDGFLVFKHDGASTVYEKRPLEFDRRNNEQSDSSGSSDVQILEPSSLFKDRKQNECISVSTSQVADKTSKFNGPSTQTGFRRRVMDVLSRPYSEAEYKNFQHDVQVRKPSERHLDLRNGREKSYSLNSKGKSYLDHHPDLKAMLSKFENDKAKCLNILRGFFFWLQNSVQEGSFAPWKDKECVAVKPRFAPR